MSHMKKWADGRDEALPLTAPIIKTLHTRATTDDPSSPAACVFDAVCLGLQTGSRCSEYCKGSPTNPSDRFCKVPSTHYTGDYAGFPLAFIPSDVTFLTSSLHFVPASEALTQASYVRIHFRFDKGGTGNLQERTFQRFPSDRPTFCPLRAILRALHRWTSLDLDPLTPLFAYGNPSSPEFLKDSTVTAHMRAATLVAYPNPTHLYHTRLKDVRTHSLRVTACLILVVAGLPDHTIEHRLRWASTAWKVYVRESISLISKACSSAFFTALEGSQGPQDPYTPQAFDVEDLL